MSKKYSGIEASIQYHSKQMNLLESKNNTSSENYLYHQEKIAELTQLLPAEKAREKVNPNVIIEVAGKVLISGVVLAIEKNGVLTTKLPITDFIRSRK